MTDLARLESLVERLTILTAMNTLMAQSSFLTVERLRIASQVVDENVSNDFGSKLYEECERLVDESSAQIEKILNEPGFAESAAERERLATLLRMRREFTTKSKSAGAEKPREFESLERMYR